MPAIVVFSARSRRSALELVRRQPVGLGDEHVDLARIEHVEIERDVCRVGAFERAVERVVESRPKPCTRPRADRGCARRRAQRRRARRRRRRGASGRAFPRGSPTARSRACSGRRASRSRRLRVDRRAGPRRSPRRHGCSNNRRGRSAGGASASAIASVCSSSVARSTIATSGYGRSTRAPCGHPFASRAPRCRHADEAGGEGRAAAVALVAVADRDRGESAAVRAARAQRTHCGALLVESSKRCDDTHADGLVEGVRSSRALGIDAEPARASSPDDGTAPNAAEQQRATESSAAANDRRTPRIRTQPSSATTHEDGRVRSRPGRHSRLQASTARERAPPRRGTGAPTPRTVSSIGSHVSVNVS